MDQCQHCECRGNIGLCEATDCGFHELWYVKKLNEIIFEQNKKIAKMEGLIK